MEKTLFASVIFVLLFAPHSSAEGVGKLCFLRDGYIYLKEQQTGAVKRITKGNDPDLSPSGKTIAYTRDLNTDTPNRLIETVDVATGRVRTFPAFNRFTQYEPLWSADEKWLAFNILIDGNWQVAVTNLETNEWKVLTKGFGKPSGVYLSSWAPGGRSVICHDLETVFEIGLNEEVLMKLPVKDVTDVTNISSETNFALSPDRKLLLFSIDQGPSDARPWGDTGLFIYEFVKKKSERLTKDGREPRWLPDGKGVIYVKYTPVARRRGRPDIYQTTLDGKENLLLTNGDSPSMLTQ